MNQHKSIGHIGQNREKPLAFDLKHQMNRIQKNN